MTGHCAIDDSAKRSCGKKRVSKNCAELGCCSYVAGPITPGQVDATEQAIGELRRRGRL